MSDKQVKPSNHGGARPGAGRKPLPKSQQARMVVKQLVDGYLPQVGGWLSQVANGLPKLNENGEPLRDSNGSIIYVTKPDPKSAVGLTLELAEFVLPKLQRSDVQVAARIEQSNYDVSKMSNEELARQVFEALGIQPFGQQQEEAIEVEFEEVERVPEWLKNATD